MLRQARRLSKHQREDTRRLWIERACVANPADAKRPPRADDDVVRGRPDWLVDDEHAVEAVGGVGHYSWSLIRD
jgi:hypothetical protein